MDKLPTDLVVEICFSLQVSDIAALAQTNSTFSLLCSSDPIWKHHYQKKFSDYTNQHTIPSSFKQTYKESVLIPVFLTAKNSETQSLKVGLFGYLRKGPNLIDFLSNRLFAKSVLIFVRQTNLKYKVGALCTVKQVFFVSPDDPIRSKTPLYAFWFPKHYHDNPKSYKKLNNDFRDTYFKTFWEKILYKLPFERVKDNSQAYSNLPILNSVSLFDRTNDVVKNTMMIPCIISCINEGETVLFAYIYLKKHKNQDVPGTSKYVENMFSLRCLILTLHKNNLIGFWKNKY